MDLFESSGIDLVQTTRPELLGWANYITQEDSDLVDSLMLKAKMEREQGKTIYPAQDDILRIFRELKPDDVRVVIIGQDPYHDGNANGRAFACKNNVSPSLRQITYAVSKYMVESKKVVVTRELGAWVAQGVFLLNTTLTVAKGQPNSHSEWGWQKFTRSVIQHLSRKKEGIVFMLWGKHAKSFASDIDEDKHIIIKDSHPQSANYAGGKWDSTCFSYCNAYFSQQNKPLIYWK